jgi:chemotaxis protein MotB
MEEINTQRAAQQAKRGLPAYMATFADLMSLLMCFFVLLLSFSEIDALKFKEVVRSMEKAFGVQRIVPANEIPMGTSIIAQEFSPGEPKPTPLNIVQQQTIDDPRRVLKVTMDAEAAAQEIARQTAEEAEEFKKALKDEIEEGLIEVENEQNRIVIRIRERGSFPSGDATLNPTFVPILKTIHDVLIDTDGLIAVAGHTDNIPIQTARYRSNWELSTSRATSVVHELLSYDQMPAERFVLEGYADTRPLLPNDSAENRAQNRRVEIVVLKSTADNETTRSIDELRRQYDEIDTEVQPLRQ